MADPYDLQRFVRAQEHDYEEALSEIRSGRKRTHWMWYIFSQFDKYFHGEPDADTVRLMHEGHEHP
jgi:uncharacterized protein (DUF1810 family)